jgi:hypothetical protein
MNVYVRAKSPIQKMQTSVMNHHRLYARREILLAAFEAYHRSQWGVFSTLAVVQIEGLFLDYCEDLGIGATELSSSSLPRKMEAVIRRADHFSDYAYYAYRLPVTRNHLAHGRLLETDAERTAQLLLLDLRDVFGHVMDEALDVNALVDRLRGAGGTPLKIEDALAVAFMDHGPPPFYALRDTWDALRALTDSDEAADRFAHLASVAREQNETGEPILAAIRRIAVNMRRKSQKKDRWISVLRAVNAGPTDPTESNAKIFPTRADFWRWIDSHS